MSALLLFVMLGALTDLVERTGLFRLPFATVSACHRILARPGHCDRALWRCYVHACHYLCGYLGTERIIAVKPIQTVSLSGYEFFFDELVQRPGPNYNALVAGFTVRVLGAGWYYGAIEAQLLRTRHYDQRGGVDVAWAGPTLSVARR